MSDENHLPLAQQSLVFRLRKRAEIRRANTERKSVLEGRPDRVSDLLEEAAATIDALTNSAWQPIDTAPRDGREILLWCPYDYLPNGGQARKGSWRVDDGFSGNKNPLWLADNYDDFSTGYASTPLDPTHWMPQPNGPSKEGSS